MRERNTRSDKGFTHGFLIGLVIGVIATLLFTTKRGRRILKVIKEEGKMRLLNIEEMLDTLVVEQENGENEELPVEEIQENYIAEGSSLAKSQPTEAIKEPSPYHKLEKSPKRFFKGIPRRSVN